MKIHQIKMRPVLCIFQDKKTGLGNKGFTLVELIVVITILSILATIAFVSLQGYSASSRDSVRITDASNIKTSLELFILNTGKYPIPDAYKEVTYSGSVIWEEGTFGEDVLRKVRKFSRSPKDPLQDVYYTYSRLNTQKEYEIGVALERDQVAFSSTQTQAAGEKLAISYITGTYNGLVAQVSTGSTTYILAVPTIISTDPTVTDIQTLVTDKKLSYTGYQNIPSSYEGTSLKTQGEPDLVLTNKLVAYSGTTLPGTTGQIGQFVGDLQTAYSGTTISNQPLIATVINVDTNNQVSIQVLGGEILNATLGGNIAVNTSTISCNGGSISGLVNTGISFDYTSINHGETNIGTGSQGVLNGNNQIFTADITCNNGEVSISNETAGSITCSAGFMLDVGNCITGEKVLWLRGDNSGNITYDSTNKHNSGVSNSNTTYSSSNKVFGNGSMYFGGGNFMIPDSTDWDLGTEDFTLNTWVYFDSLPSGNSYHSLFNRGVNSFQIMMANAWFGINGLWHLGAGDLSDNNLASWQTGKWYHISLERNGNNWTLYKDGVSVATQIQTAGVSNTADGLTIGGYSFESGGGKLNGYLDEFEIIKGRALHTGNFDVMNYYCSQSEYANDSKCANKCTASGLWCDQTTNTSCKYILDNSLSIGNGNYWIDPDGIGGKSPMKAYCDMTIDGGGWTMITSQSTYGMGDHNTRLSSSESQLPSDPTSIYPTWYKDLPGDTEMLLKSKDTLNVDRWVTLPKISLYFNNNKINEVQNNGLSVLATSGNWTRTEMNTIGQRLTAIKYYIYGGFDGPQTSIIWATGASYTVGASDGGPTASDFGGNSRPTWYTEYVQYDYGPNGRVAFSGSDNMTPRFWIYVR